MEWFRERCHHDDDPFHPACPRGQCRRPLQQRRDGVSAGHPGLSQRFVRVLAILRGSSCLGARSLPAITRARRQAGAWMVPGVVRRGFFRPAFPLCLAIRVALACLMSARAPAVGRFAGIRHACLLVPNPTGTTPLPHGVEQWSHCLELRENFTRLAISRTRSLKSS